MKESLLFFVGVLVFAFVMLQVKIATAPFITPFLAGVPTYESSSGNQLGFFQANAIMAVLGLFGFWLEKRWWK